jgi:GT2 family glycosyltransferase
MQTSVTIQIVGWNSAKHLPQTVTALKAIPAEEVIIRYIDNASSDNSVSIVHDALPHADIIELGENKGFAGDHNIGFSMCTTPFVLTHDPDLTLHWPGMRRLLRLFDNPEVGALQGMLLRDGEASTPIDSAGIVHTITLNGKERGAGEKNNGQYDKQEHVLAVTGACGLYRVAALRDVSEEGEIFDADFFAYKEDVDLGWRLNRAGWKVMYYPVLMGHHHRTLGKRGFMNWGLNFTAVQNRLRSPRTYYSIRNYNWMIASYFCMSCVPEMRGIFWPVMMTSTSSCRPKNSNPRPSAKNLVHLSVS